MTGLDFFLLIIILVGMITGYLKGFIRQLASVLGFIVGLIAAKLLYATVAEKLVPTITDSMTVAQVLAFVLIWIAVPLAFTVVAALLTKTMEAVSLRWVDRLLGVFFGGLSFLLFISLAICLIEYFDTRNTFISETKKKESLFYYPIEKAAGIAFPVAEKVTKQLILDDDDATRGAQ